MQFINLYTQKELAEKRGVERHRLALDVTAIPVKIETAQTRANNKNGYATKYIDYLEVKKYVKYNRKPKPKPLNNDYKFKTKATK